MNTDNLMKGFFMGILAGAGAAYFLQTEKGKKVRADVANKIDQAQINSKEFAVNTVERLKVLADEASVKGQEVMDQAQNTFVSAKETISENVLTGTEKAKKIIANKEQEIKAQLNNV